MPETAPAASGTAPAPVRRARRWLRIPELGPQVALVLVWLFFAGAAGPAVRSLAGTAAWLNAAAPLGILAVAVGLLMIGGEFDLSVGSVIGVSGLGLLLLTTEAGWPMGAAIAAVLLLAAAIGAANGLLVVRTGVPSFLVTLGSLFVLRGLTIALVRRSTGRTQLGGLDDVSGYAFWRALFAFELGPFHAMALWWLVLLLLAWWVLRRTRTGNWILAAGGAAEAARNSGVPVRRVKVGLFVATALGAALVGIIQAVRYTGADALRGEGQEFRAIVAAVIGGTLLTGGYGSALGVAIGALIFGMVQQGIVITGVDADWFQVFLGAMLIAAVLVNDAMRRRALAAS
ncbi:MAG: ABC transporter permease [Gemmatimonadetes bacterium]|nr:ABC transporter permease [Gemmatimonadota bacterium]